MDEASMVPDMVLITPAKVSDRRGVDNFRYPPVTIVVDDRGYFDFSLFKQRVDDENIFVTRIKDNTKADPSLIYSQQKAKAKILNNFSSIFEIKIFENQILTKWK